MQKWIIENGFGYSGNDGCDDFNSDEEDSVITKEFVNVLIGIVKDIHEKGILTDKFGKELPILIHELEYYDEIAEQNIEANGEDLVSDFTNRCQNW
ncbi:MAG: hypothetical protein PUI31_05345 [Clostridia bacterium]|nr:hypothetical protein [Clostridia bacterium]